MLYANIPQPIGNIVSSRLATRHELQTVYGTEDMYDFLEILSVDSHNRRVMVEINANRT